MPPDPLRELALLEAIVSGYEVALRIGRDHARDLSERGFRTTSIYGAIGAAAAKDGSTVEWLDRAGEEGYDLTWDVASAMIAALFREAGCSRESCDALAGAVWHVGATATVPALLSAARAAVASITHPG